MVMGNYTFGSRITGINEMPINDKLFILQSDIIKSAADKGPCVVIGRCGDYILRDYKNVFRVFIHANKDARVARILRKGLCEEKRSPISSQNATNSARTTTISTRTSAGTISRITT